MLELGGSDPFVVMPSADLDKAAEVATTARCQNNGQSCIAAKRFIVHDAVADEFERLFAEKLAALPVGDPMDDATKVGPLATESGRADVEELVQDAVDKGARVVVGGKRPDRPGWFYPPTLITEITPQMRMHREEVFGPVASLYRVPDLDAAIELANDTDFGLGSNIWTDDPAEREKFVRDIEAGHGRRQRDDDQLSGTAVRRRQGQRLRPGAHRTSACASSSTSSPSGWVRTPASNSPHRAEFNGGMKPNRSVPAPTVIPVLTYPDVGEAVAWLSSAFGFVERVRIGENHRAQLKFGGGAVIVADTGSDRRAPRPGEITHSVMVRVADARAHCQRARAQGAHIVMEPTDMPFGELQYTADDPAGHRWTFSETVADVAPEEWGGESVQSD